MSELLANCSGNKLMRSYSSGDDTLPSSLPLCIKLSINEIGSTMEHREWRFYWANRWQGTRVSLIGRISWSFFVQLWPCVRLSVVSIYFCRFVSMVHRVDNGVFLAEYIPFNFLRQFSRNRYFNLFIRKTNERKVASHFDGMMYIWIYQIGGCFANLCIYEYFDLALSVAPPSDYPIDWSVIHLKHFRLLMIFRQPVLRSQGIDSMATFVRTCIAMLVGAESLLNLSHEKHHHDVAENNFQCEPVFGEQTSRLKFQMNEMWWCPVCMSPISAKRPRVTARMC